MIKGFHFRDNLLTGQAGGNLKRLDIIEPVVEKVKLLCESWSLRVFVANKNFGY